MEEESELMNATTEPKPKLSRLRRAAPTEPQETVPTAPKEIVQEPAQHPSAVGEAAEAAGSLSKRSPSEVLSGELSGPSEFASSRQPSQTGSGPAASAQNSDSQESSRSSEADESGSRQHYNEEDELLEYITRTKQRFESQQEYPKASSGSTHDDRGSIEECHEDHAAESGGGIAEDSADEDVHVSTQRLMRETAKGDRIGKGPPRVLKPINEMLATLCARLEANKARVAKTSCISLPADPAKRKAFLRGESMSAAAGPAGLAGMPQLSGGAPIPKVAKAALNAAAMDMLLADLPPVGDDDALVVESDQELEAAGAVAKQDPDAENKKVDSLHPSEEMLEGHDEEGSTEQENARQSESPEPSLKEGGGISEEELDDISSESSSTDSSSEDGSEPDSPMAHARALEEARAMLHDQQHDDRGHFFEDEAEMSEDEGHSEDSETDGDEAEHAQLLGELIGYEQDRKGDEKRRAQLHAKWQADEDEKDLKKILQGVKNGFRSRANPFLPDDEDRSLEDARRRRAAADHMPQSSASGSEESSDEDDEAVEVDVADVSDDDMKSYLLDCEAQRQTALSQGELVSALQRYKSACLQACIVDDIKDEGQDQINPYAHALPLDAAPREPERNSKAALTGLTSRSIFKDSTSDSMLATGSFMQPRAMLTTSRSAHQAGASKGFVWRDTSQAGSEQAVEEIGGKEAVVLPSLKGAKRERKPLTVQNQPRSSFYERPEPKAPEYGRSDQVDDMIAELLTKRPRKLGQA